MNRAYMKPSQFDPRILYDFLSGGVLLCKKTADFLY